MIACLYTGHYLPQGCAPMPRSPEPEVGMYFDVTFPDHLTAAISQNPAVHDGAVMIGRGDANERYIIVGWSYRLFPSSGVLYVEANRADQRSTAVLRCRSCRVSIGST